MKSNKLKELSENYHRLSDDDFSNKLMWSRDRPWLHNQNVIGASELVRRAVNDIHAKTQSINVDNVSLEKGNFTQ